MESLHKIESRSWISEVIPPSYFTEYYADLSNLRNSSSNDVNHVENMMELTNLPEDTVRQLEDQTSVDQLACEGEIVPKCLQGTYKLLGAVSKEPSVVDQQASNIPERGMDCLVTLKIQSEELVRRKDPMFAKSFLKSMKYYEMDRLQRFSQLWHHKPGEGKQNRGEVLFTVAFYRPAQVQTLPTTSKKQLGQIDVQYQVVGSNYLCELKDKLICPSDHMTVPVGPTSARGVFGVVRKEIYPSSYFFIEDTFYNDMRHINSNDLSKTVREWAVKSKGVGELKLGDDMDKVKFKDLSIRLGRPYLYLHQGSCQHLITFSDARLLHKHDFQEASRYPLIIDITPRRPVVCMICNRFTSKFIATEHTRVPELPFHFCEECHHWFNYDPSGNPIGTFKITPFYDKSATTA